MRAIPSFSASGWGPAGAAALSVWRRRPRVGDGRRVAAVIMGCAAALSAAAHTHLEVRLQDGRLGLELHEYGEGSFDPAATPVVVGPAARRANPPALANLLGTAPAVWILPQNEDPRLVFLGIGAESIPRAALAGGGFQLELRHVEGPGDFVVYQTLPFGEPKVLFSTRDGLPDELPLRAGPGTHLHANWAFTAPGVYRATFAARGALAATGAPADSADTVYTFVVPPPEPPRLGIQRTHLLLPGGLYGPVVIEAAAAPPAWSAVLDLNADGRPQAVPWPAEGAAFRLFRVVLP